MSVGYVYIIDPYIQINGRTVVKIGMTKRDPHRRLKQLQTSLPVKASLIHSARFPNAQIAEKTLHRMLDGHRVRSKGGTEFFFLDPREAVNFVNQLAYQISAQEARKALERDLDNFAEQISRGLGRRITKWSILSLFCGTFLYYAIQEESVWSGILAMLVVAILGVWLFIGMAAAGVAEVIVRIVWRKQIKAERKRLLNKYPAAKDIS